MNKKSQAIILAVFITLSLALIYVSSSKNKTLPPPSTEEIASPLEQQEANKPNRYEITFSLPSGWTSKTEVQEFFGDSNHQYYLIEKENYKLVVGKLTTGTYCSDEYRNFKGDKISEYLKILNNSNLSQHLYRQSPNSDLVMKDESIINLDTFTRDDSSDCANSITPIGIIEYTIPRNWNQSILNQMDSIIESISFKEISE